MAKVKCTIRPTREGAYAVGIVGEDGKDWEPGKTYLATDAFAADLVRRGIADVDADGEEAIDQLGRNPAGVTIQNGDPVTKGGRK